MNELYINDNRIELGKDTIAISSQINTLSDLKDHNSNLTNRFKVPETKSNISALAAIHEAQSSSVIPYRKNSARLLMDGVEIIKNGYAVVESSDSVYNITVYSGNVNFFDLIDAITLQDLDLGALNHTFEFFTIINSVPFTAADGYKYPVVNYGQLTNDTRTINPADLRLFFFCSYLFKKIITDQGLTYDGAFFTLPNFLKLMLSGGNDNLKNQYFDKLGRLALGKQFDIVSGSPPFNENWIELLTGETWTITVRLSFQIQAWNNGSSAFGFSYLGVIYTHTDADGTGAFLITVTGTTTGPANGAFILVFHDSDGFATDGEITYQRSTASEPEIFVHIKATGYQSATGSVGDIQLYCELDFKAAYGFTSIDVAKELPKITQKDFIKSIGHIFGLMFRTSTRENKIYIKQFSEIVDAIPLAVDWTYKMDMRNQSVLEYRLGGYSQKNNCKYTEDDTDLEIPDEFGNGAITIDDKTLQAEQDIIQLPYAATIYSKKLINFNTATIRRIDDATGEWSNETKPRILYDNIEAITSGDPLTFDDGDNSPSTSTNIPLPHFIREDKSSNLGFTDSILNENYLALSRVLNKTKRITELFKLTPIDIYKFTEGNPLTEGHFIPVYLHQFGAAFYVSKIINYTGEGLTRVELIRLGQADPSLLNACYNEFYPGEQLSSDTGWTYDPNYSFEVFGLLLSFTGGGTSTAAYNTFRRLKPNKCYKLIAVNVENSSGAVSVVVRINGGEATLTKNIAAGFAGTVNLGSFNLGNALSGDFLSLIVTGLTDVSLVIAQLKIVSCDCDEF